MLPDYPETKHLFSRFFQTYMRQRMRQISPFAMIQTRHIHEGRTMRVTRSDDTQSESPVVEQSVALEIKFDEIETLTLEKVIAKHDAIVAEMASKQAQFIRERLSADIPQSQSLDGRGRKLDARMVIEMFDKLQLEFYPDGRPHEIHVDGITAEHMAAIDREFQENPELKNRLDELIGKKREEWVAREANRKLVG